VQNAENLRATVDQLVAKLRLERDLRLAAVLHHHLHEASWDTQAELIAELQRVLRNTLESSVSRHSSSTAVQIEGILAALENGDQPKFSSPDCPVAPQKAARDRAIPDVPGNEIASPNAWGPVAQSPSKRIRNVILNRKKPTEKPSAPTPARKRGASTAAEPGLSGRRSELPKFESKTVDWVHVHFSERKGYARVHVGHKHNPIRHAALCQRLRDGNLGCGYYMQVEDCKAPPGSLLEVLHARDINRVNFDTLDDFLKLNPAGEPDEAGN
jgi:hypothetical protein